MDRKNVEKRINCKKRFYWSFYYFIGFFSVLLITSVGADSSCGGYYEVVGTQTINSPNYPAQYDDVSNCIWIARVASAKVINLTLTFTGERYNGACSDYIEVRDGGPDSNILGTYCDAHTNVELQTSSNWIFIQLKSDQITMAGQGLHSTIRAATNPSTSSIQDVTTRVPECRSYEFACPNRMCISMSYRCDDYNDCGCIDDCDEDGCGSLDIDLSTQIMISVGVGVSVFILICVLAYSLDSRNKWSVPKPETAPPLKKLYFKAPKR